MFTIKVHTAQNVDIDYQVATVLDRIFAYLLDVILITIVYIGIIVAVVFLKEKIFDTSEYFIIGLMVLFLLLPYFFYDLLCEIFLNGQSFGKKLMNIKVIRIDGERPSILNYLLRWMLRPIDIGISYGGVAIITILVNGKGQRLGDLAAGTAVIKLKQEINLEDTILEQLDENYRLTYAEVGKLNEEIISIVKEVLDFAKKNKKGRTEDILKKTKTKLEEKMKINSGLDPLEFLKTVLLDYNYLHQDQK